MRLDDAIKAHAAWKLRLSLLNQGVSSEPIPDARTLARDDVCELGKWIHGEAPRTFGDDRDFQALVRAHAQFHVATAGLVERIKAGAKLTQDEIDSSDYARSSLEVIALLQALKRRHATE